MQKTRTERILEALRDLTSPRALVIRDGERKRIAGREVVHDDFVVLSCHQADCGCLCARLVLPTLLSEKRDEGKKWEDINA